MRVLRRTVYFAAVAAVLGSGLAACSSSQAGEGAVGTTPGSAASQVAAVSRDVSFVVAGTTTYGTLDIPAHRPGQRLAAALLLAGSGPTDRNGNDAAVGIAPYILRLIAGELARMGIMSLRFDKYFSGQTGGGAFAADPGSIDLAAYIRQADAAYDFLRAQPETNTRQMLVVGHSEGGMYALVVAESVSPHPAGLALIEPQDERLLSLIQLQTDEQIDAAVRQGMLTAASGRRNAAGVQQAISEFRAGQPVDTSGLAPGVVQLITPELLSPVNTRYVRSDDAVYPPSVASPAGQRHPGPGHRRHRGHQCSAQHDQAAGRRPGRGRGHRARPARARRRQPFAAPARRLGKHPDAGPIGGGRAAGLGAALRPALSRWYHAVPGQPADLNPGSAWDGSAGTALLRNVEGARSARTGSLSCPSRKSSPASRAGVTARY